MTAPYVPDATPILVGVGQVVSHWDGTDPADAPSPVSLARDAVLAALEDTGAAEQVSALVDTVAFVRLNTDSMPNAPRPFDLTNNLPASVADAAGLSTENLIYSEVGGDKPQALVNEFAEKLFAGSVNAVVLAGSEAIGAEKLARKKRITLDWSTTSDADFEDRSSGETLLTDEEISNGLAAPLQTYPLFENALRTRLGLSRDDYLQHISEVFAPYSKVAETNPYSQFPGERNAEYLATESKDNYRVTDTFLKWHVAQDAVNQGASVIMTTVGAAKEAGIPGDKWVFLHGYAKAQDLNVTERPDLSRSPSIELSIERAVSSAGMTSSELSVFDIYSCFPCVVQLAAEALGLDPTQETLTVTGGLPFFGGPGNNYSMHGIASMVERLRETPGATGLVLANGGFISKHAVGVYSTNPVSDWAPVSSDDLNPRIESNRAEQAAAQPEQATVDTYAIFYGRFAPKRGVAISHSAAGRSVNRFRSDHRATMQAFLAEDEPVGTDISFHTNRGKSYVSPSARIGSDADDRAYEYVEVQRNDKILEVTLNRPEAYNALFGPAHYELAEIFDEYERDRDLWVAIITGAGDKAFCSGNDLKATARGGDVGTPRSGFAGLCSRFNREKPLIAAVNGVAMGGGLEIVLASDLAVIDPGATCALPEVNVGLFAAAGGVQRLTRQIGTKAATELILTGRHFDAEEALALGVVNSISEPGMVMEEARALAERILSSSPSAVQASKRVLNDFEALDYDLETSMKNGGRVFGQLMRTNDFTEGVTAFGEKRPPEWTNS